MKAIAITGSNGFIGEYLKSYFSEKKYKIITITREDLKDENILKDKISKADIVVNLAGAPILKRWSKRYKNILYKSRIQTTRAVVNAINSTEKEQLLISTSAIGIYKDIEMCDEDNHNYADTFLAHICEDWEKEARKSQKRVAIFRLGLVFGKDGALKKMILPFKLGVGGKIADGKQAISYIHIEDLARAYIHVIDNRLSGVFNLVTPNPTTNINFTKTLAKKLNRPAIFPVPAKVLKLLFGEGARVLIKGEKVYPKNLLDSGFEFKFKKIEDILDNLI